LASDAMLMGRETYEFFAAAFPHQKGDYGRRINENARVRLLQQPEEGGLEPFVHRRRDVATEAAKLKRQDGKDLVIYGHGLLARTLLEEDLLDELKLWIHLPN
jgi:dihydrofolate reductase